MEPAVEKALAELFQAEKNMRKAVAETFPEGAMVAWKDHHYDKSYQRTGLVASGRTFDPKSVCVRAKDPGSPVDHFRFLPAALLTLAKE